MLSLFIVCFSFPHIVLSNEFPSFFYRLQLPSATGPESLAFALKGEGPYTGVADGRILKYGGPNIGFVEFATTSPHRTKELCDGTNDHNLGSICGRPLGLGFNDITGLSGATGVAVSKDGAFILVTELITSRIRRFWVKGPKANSAEILTYLPGNPDNIIRTILGEFWVAANIQNQQPTLPVGLRIDVFGNILQSFSVGIKYNTTLISEVHEHDGASYAGSLFTMFVGVYKR